MARKLWGLVDIQAAFTLFDYEAGGALSNAIHQIKYGGRADLAEEFGEMIGDAFSSFFTDIGIDLLIPVPLSKDRLRQRGYNQSEWLAKGISNVTGIAVNATVLERIAFKESQTKLNAIERQNNVDNAFRLVEGTSIVDKHVLLIDDVMTTGATLKACAMLLEQIEGVRISIATLGVTRT